MEEEQIKKSRTGKKEVKVSHQQVANRYDGFDHSGITYVRQAVGVASRLSHKTIESIGYVCNFDCSDSMVNENSSNQNHFSSSNDARSTKDCRLFRKFVCFGSLRSSKTFMNAFNDKKEYAQVNTVHRMKHWCELNNHKSIQAQEITCLLYTSPSPRDA